MNATDRKYSDSFDYKLNNDGDDLDLLESFRESFPELSSIRTKEQFLTMVNINNSIRDWYLTYKQYRSTFLVKPDWLPNDKESLDNWSKLQDKLADQKGKFRDWEQRIESKSKILKNEIEAVRREKEVFFKNLDPLLIIDSLTVNNLSPKDALDIALEGDLDSRRRLTEQKLLALKEKMYNGYLNGTFVNPYLK